MRTLSHAYQSSSTLTGFISLEEVHLQASPSSPTSPTLWKRRQSVLSSLTQQKWFYGVFQYGALRCYRRHADIKLNREPFRVVALDLDATFVSERQALVVQCRETGKTLRLRVHGSSSSSYVQWITALYLARLDGSESDRSSDSSEASPTRGKRVTFNEDTSESMDHAVDSPTACTTWQEAVNLGDLYYTREDFEGFRRSYRMARRSSSAMKSLDAGRKVVQSFVSRLRSSREVLGSERV